MSRASEELCGDTLVLIFWSSSCLQHWLVPPPTPPPSCSLQTVKTSDRLQIWAHVWLLFQGQVDGRGRPSWQRAALAPPPHIQVMAGAFRDLLKDNVMGLEKNTHTSGERMRKTAELTVREWLHSHTHTHTFKQCSYHFYALLHLVHNRKTSVKSWILWESLTGLLKSSPAENLSFLWRCWSMFGLFNLLSSPHKYMKRRSPCISSKVGFLAGWSRSNASWGFKLVA